MGGMKTNIPPRLGMIDAIGAGLNQAGRRPWLWLFPALIDLVLWLAPRLSVEQLGLRLIRWWQTMLPLAYSSAQIAGMQDVITFAQESMAELGKQVNLLNALAFGWLTPPSALASWQPTRFTLFSDGVLAPLGLGLNLGMVGPSPLRLPAIELPSVGAAFLVVVAAWLIGQVVVALFYRTAALGLQPVLATPKPQEGRIPRRNETPPAGETAAVEAVNPPALGILTLRIAAVSVLAAVSAFMLTLPLAFVGLFAQLTGGGELLIAISGGLTLWMLLWFLSALFFVGDLLVLDGAPVWASLIQSFVFVRANGFRMLTFAALVNLIMLGARAMWGLIGATPLGALVAIGANAVLVSGMLLSIFIYYRGMRRYWLAVRALGPAGR